MGPRGDAGFTAENCSGQVCSPLRVVSGLGVDGVLICCGIIDATSMAQQHLDRDGAKVLVHVGEIGKEVLQIFLDLDRCLQIKAFGFLDQGSDNIHLPAFLNFQAHGFVSFLASISIT